MGFAPRPCATGPRSLRVGHFLVLMLEAFVATTLGACAHTVPPVRVEPALQARRVVSIDPDEALSLFQRALAAREREDDAAASSLFHRVLQLRLRITDAHATELLAQLDTLVADQDRRATEPPRHFCFADAMAVVDAASRIAGLVRDLDQASPLISSDAFLEALVHEGPGAIDPLLDALDRDMRLTRNFVRDPATGAVRVESVADIAYRVLFDLLLVPLHRTPSMRWDQVRDGPTRHVFAETLRAYWTAARRMR